MPVKEQHPAKEYSVKTALVAALFLSVAVSCFSAASWLSSRIDPQYPKERDRFSRLVGSAGTLVSLTVGNSHSKALHKDTFLVNGARIRLNGADMLEIEYVVSQLLPRLPSLEVLYIPISYTTFILDNIHQNESRRVKTYHLTPCSGLSCFRLIDGDVKSWIKGIFLPVTRFDNWENVIFRTLQDGDSSTGEKSDDAEVEQPADKKGKRAREHLRSAKESTEETHSKLIASLERTIEFALDHVNRVVLFTPPYYETYIEELNRLHPTLIDWTRVKMQSIADENGVFYRDYNDAVSLPWKYFRNEDHFNQDGVKKFSLVMYHDLVEFYGD